MSTYHIYQESLSHSLLKILSSAIEENLSYKLNADGFSFLYTTENNVLNTHTLFAWFKEQNKSPASLCSHQSFWLAL